MTWLKWLSAAIVLVVVRLVALSAYGAMRWRSLTDELNVRLEAARKQPRPALRDARTRWLAGTFNLGESADQWKPFTSKQRVVTRSGLAWLGQRLFWGQAYRWWMSLVVSGGFLVAHLSHTALV